MEKADYSRTICILVLSAGMAVNAAASSPAPPSNFRCTAPPTGKEIKVAWNAAPPSAQTRKPVTYQISVNGPVVGSKITGTSFTLTPAMFRGGVFPTDTTNHVRLQSVDENVRTPGKLPTMSSWIQLNVLIRKSGQYKTFCKPAR